jgi:hypothetical protein
LFVRKAQFRGSFLAILLAEFLLSPLEISQFLASRLSKSVSRCFG